jgi:ABC-type lipoprotein export system ATPase subunit
MSSRSQSSEPPGVRARSFLEPQVCTTQDKDKNEPDREAHGHTSRLDWLKAYGDRQQDDRARYRRLETCWSALRLIIFVAGIAAVILLRHDARVAELTGIAGTAIFVGAVWQHTKWQNRRFFVESLLTVVEESLQASTRRDRPARAWQRPEDLADPSASLPVILEPGPTWPLTAQEQDDLDLYGPPVGIFGLLNRTSTPLGARRLRDMLDSLCLSGAHIRQRQQAVQWLDIQDEQRLRLMAALVSLRSHAEKLDAMVRLLHTTPPPWRSRASTAIRLWSAISGPLGLWALLCITGGQYGWVRPLVVLFMVNTFILLLLRSRLRSLKASVLPWAAQRSTLDCFLAVARHARRELPDKTQLRLLRSRFREIVTDARVPSLCGWLGWAGLHGMVRSLLDVLIFLDLHIAEAVLMRVTSDREVLLHGLAALAELEALGSLACFSAEQRVACYPEPMSQTGLTIKDGRHPLIREQDVAANSISLTPDKRTWVITGPNAAGKSTFLRMVGVNVLLAQTGAAVPAAEMAWSPVRLITDVRIRDDLAKNESYFLSEVRRLRRLVLDGEKDTPILGLIDEPFRGTNSQERTAAGLALLEHLTASPNLFLIATHEELLAQVAARTASASNYHFQEHLHDGGVTFDYQLRPGPATTKTALHILEREGYPNSLLERARRLLADGTQGTPSG